MKSQNILIMMDNIIVYLFKMNEQIDLTAELTTSELEE